MKKILHGENQKKIYDLIAKNPGLYLSKIAEMTNLDVSQTKDVLAEMENKRLIVTVSEHGDKQCYIDPRLQGVHHRKIQEIRKQICTLIAENPGIYLSEIAEMLGMRVSLAEYHLLQLEKGGIVVTSKEVGYRRYYMGNSDIGAKERRLLSILRHKIPLHIVLLLLQKRVLQHRDLLRSIDIPPSTLTYHMNKLLHGGIIDVNTFGDERGYVIKDRKTVMFFLTKYRLYRLADGFKDIWDDIMKTM